jgi:KaiC/GvpD/RAD55 family RecA-like ATPase
MRYFPTKDKQPIISDWPNKASETYPDTMPDHEEWGLVTGEDFWVLDVDKKHPEAFAWLQSKTDIPNTYTVSTRNGGRHLYFKKPEGITVRNKQCLLGVPGVDVRGEGGYVIAPGSPGYVVVNDNDPIVYAPQWLIDAVSKVPSTLVPTAANDAPEGVKGALNKRTLRFIAEGAIPGAWHQELYQAAMDCKANGYSEFECEQLLSKATGELDSSHDLPLIRDVYQNRTPLYGGDMPEAMIVPASSLMSDMWKYLKDPGARSGTSTGILGLDDMLGGGIRPGEVVGVLAPAKAGKSSFTHKIIHSWIKNGNKVAYASREMRQAEEVLPNILSIEYKKNLLKEGELDPNITPELLNNLVFAIGHGYLSIEELEAFYEQAYASGCRMFLLDHFHHFIGSEDYSEISKFAKTIKSLTLKYNVATILVVQPRTVRIDQTKITNNDIRGGAVVGQAFDAVLVLERQKNELGRVTNIVKVTLDIARHKLAKPGEIYLEYDRDTMDFSEVVELLDTDNEKEVVDEARH